MRVPFNAGGGVGTGWPRLHAAAGSFAMTTGLAGDAAMVGVAGSDPRGQPVCGVVEHGGGVRPAQAADQVEATLAATVSPAMVAASRTRLASLVAATLGQNAPAIAAAG